MKKGKEAWQVKKRPTAIVILFILSLLLAACNNTGKENGEENKPDENTIVSNGESEPNGVNLPGGDKIIDDKVDGSADNDKNSDKEDNKLLTPEEISEQLVEAIEREDMVTIAHFVHPEKGLLFSPYVHVDDSAVVIEQVDIANLLLSDEVFTWGVYDGKGTPIELTPAGYFEKFLDMTPYEETEEILINDLQNRGNTINNMREKFPNATIIEYYHEGSEEYGGNDWSSVLFVFEEDIDGVNQLIAIIRDMWTI